MDTSPQLERLNLVEHVPSAVGCCQLRGKDDADTAVRTYQKWVGPNCMQEFWTWARQQGRATFLAHNGKAYDTLILMKMVQHEFTKLDHPPPPVTRGNSVLQLRIGEICFLDSLMHMKGSVAKMPEVYGFEKEMRKGLIPYAWFSSFEKLNGPTQFLPDKHFFPQKLQDGDFHVWHDSIRKKEKELSLLFTVFQHWRNFTKKRLDPLFVPVPKEYLGGWNPRAELEAYLKEDVLILAEGCARHRELFISTSATSKFSFDGLDPFCGKIVTLASGCYKAFRANFYDESQYRLPQWIDTKIRSGVAGGNCNSHRRRARLTVALAKQGYYIKHVDFTSEYPYSMLVNDMPSGKPTVSTFDPPREPTPGERASFTNGMFFGYITADFHPPPDCIHPIIGKAEPHGPLLEWLGVIENVTITSMELKIALEEGYEITNIRHFFEFKRHSSFWKGYMKHFVRMKVESEDYSKMSDDDLRELMFIYKQEFDIDLREDKLREPENPGLRAVAKNWINTIHGRWGMRLQQDRTAFVTPEKYLEMKEQQLDGRLELKEFTEINHEQGIVKSCETFLEDENRTLNEVNAALSLWVAACGRCMLHRELVQLGVRALYWDTDSVVYLHDPQGYNPLIGYHRPYVSEKNKGKFNVLGSLTDEMDGLCSLNFCGPKPKTYGYKYLTEDECLELNECELFVRQHGKIDLQNKKVKKNLKKKSKVMAKGFVQTSVTAGALNFETLCDLVEGKAADIAVPTTVWQRCPAGKGALADTQGVLTYDKPKMLMDVSNVKCSQQDYSCPYLPCLPYGHKDLTEEATATALELLEKDGRVHRATLAREKEEQCLRETKRKRDSAGENRKKRKLAPVKHFCYILQGGTHSYVGSTSCEESLFEQHLANLEGVSVREKMCYAQVPDIETAKRLEHMVKKPRIKKARLRCMQHHCKDNGWFFKVF